MSMALNDFLGEHPLLTLLWRAPHRRLGDPDYLISWGGAQVESHAQIFRSTYVLHKDPQRRAADRVRAVNEIRANIANAMLLGVPRIVTDAGMVKRYTAGVLYLAEHLPRIPRNRWRLGVLRPLTHTIVDDPLAACEQGEFLAEVGLYILSEAEENTEKLDPKVLR